MKANLLVAAALLVPSVALSQIRGPFCESVEIHSNRGIHAGKNAQLYVAENSLAAMNAADKAGFSWVSVGVQYTFDRVPVLHHDNEIGRSIVATHTPTASHISQLSLDQFTRNTRLRLPSGTTLVEPPNTLAQAVNFARVNNMGLHVEVRQEVDCDAIRRTVQIAAPLQENIRWSTQLTSVARCLANERVHYLALNVGPPQNQPVVRSSGSPEESGGIMNMIRQRLQSLGDGESRNGNNLYALTANRRFATGHNLSEVAEILNGARMMAIHIPASDLERTPSFGYSARSAGLRWGVYANVGEDQAKHAIRNARIRPGIFVTDAPTYRDSCRN